MEYTGQRKPLTGVKYLSAVWIDESINEWQIAKLLEVCVSLKTLMFEHKGRQCMSVAIGVNPEEADIFMPVITEENIPVLCQKRD